MEVIFEDLLKLSIGLKNRALTKYSAKSFLFRDHSFSVIVPPYSMFFKNSILRRLGRY